MDTPLNVADVQTSSLESTATGDAAWVGGFFAYGGGNGGNANRPSLEFIDNCAKNAVVHIVETVLIHI